MVVAQEVDSVGAVFRLDGGQGRYESQQVPKIVAAIWQGSWRLGGLPPFPTHYRRTKGRLFS